MVGDRTDDIVAGVSYLRDEVADIGKALAVLTNMMETQVEDTATLKSQMRTALMPILFAKWLVAVCVGLSTVGGALWGLLKILEGLKA